MDLLDVNMPEEVIKQSVQDPSFEERSNLIKLVSLPSSCEKDGPGEVEESSSVNNIKTEKNDGIGQILSPEL